MDKPTVTLVDGTVTDTWSEAWRIECEAREILNLPSLYERRARLEKIQQKRGILETEKIKRVMKLLFDRRLANSGA